MAIQPNNFGVTHDLIGSPCIVHDGRGTYEVHQKDAEGYEITIAGPGLSEEEARDAAAPQED